MIELKEGIQPVTMLSGGRTSGYMLRRLLDMFPDYRTRFITCFDNTGKERPETLDFVHEIETRWDVPVVWLEYTRVPAKSIRPDVFPTKRRNDSLAKAAAANEHTHWFKVVNYETASRDGKPFDDYLSASAALPNATGRGCSAQLKIRTSMRWLWSNGIHEHAPVIGIRADESHRTIQIKAHCESFQHPLFPLVEWGVSEPDIMAFWKDSDFDLQLQSYEGNCDMCFLKAKHKLIRLARDNPGMIDWWIAKERDKSSAGTGGTFRLGKPYTLIKQWAEEPTFLDKLDAQEQDIACSCAEKGFGDETD